MERPANQNNINSQNNNPTHKCIIDYGPIWPPNAQIDAGINNRPKTKEEKQRQEFVKNMNA